MTHKRKRALFNIKLYLMSKYMNMKKEINNMTHVSESTDSFLCALDSLGMLGKRGK